MVNKPLIRPAISGGGSFGGGPARIPMMFISLFRGPVAKELTGYG